MEKKFTRKEIEARNNKRDAVFIIDNDVYDVTSFQDEHPGGHEVLLNIAGQDASEDFADIGHSLDAKELMKKFKIGEVVDEDRVEVKRRHVTWDNTNSDSDVSFFSSWKFPLFLGVVATVLYSYLFG